jgi:Zn-dependent membrane protease YugP
MLFTIVTLPVEFDASRRGLRLLDQSGLMQAESDRQGSRQVLRAAALNLLYYLRLAGRGRR